MSALENGIKGINKDNKKRFKNNRLSKPKVNFKDFWLKEKMGKEEAATFTCYFICFVLFFYARFQKVDQK